MFFFALSFPCHAQPKLNGFRAVYLDGAMYSRNGHKWPAPVLKHIVEPLANVVGARYILDGELYRHGWTLDRIADAIALHRREPCADTTEVAFYVFDIFTTSAFADRVALYHKLVKSVRCEHVQAVPASPVPDIDTADALHGLYNQSGVECSIYRLGEYPYQCGRSSLLLKRKDRRGTGFTEVRKTQNTEFTQRETCGSSRDKTADVTSSVARCINAGQKYLVETRLWAPPLQSSVNKPETTATLPNHPDTATTGLIYYLNSTR